MLAEFLKAEGEFELFVAGQIVPAGIYRDIERNREVHLPDEDALPASLDGRVACYVLVKSRWRPTAKKADDRPILM